MTPLGLSIISSEEEYGFKRETEIHVKEFVSMPYLNKSELAKNSQKIVLNLTQYKKEEIAKQIGQLIYKIMEEITTFLNVCYMGRYPIEILYSNTPVPRVMGYFECDEVLRLAYKLVKSCSSNRK